MSFECAGLDLKCDGCEACLAPNAAYFSCIECDFDLCALCADAGRMMGRAAPQSQGAREGASTPTAPCSAPLAASKHRGVRPSPLLPPLAAPAPSSPARASVSAVAGGASAKRKGDATAPGATYSSSGLFPRPTPRPTARPSLRTLPRPSPLSREQVALALSRMLKEVDAADPPSPYSLSSPRAPSSYDAQTPAPESCADGDGANTAGGDADSGGSAVSGGASADGGMPPGAPGPVLTIDAAGSGVLFMTSQRLDVAGAQRSLAQVRSSGSATHLGQP